VKQQEDSKEERRAGSFLAPRRCAFGKLHDSGAGEFAEIQDNVKSIGVNDIGQMIISSSQWRSAVSFCRFDSRFAGL
jgi:hypothetical protein